MARIIFPEDYLSQRQLLKDINKKNIAEGANFTLKPYFTQQGIVMADDLAAGNNADPQEALRKSLSNQAENHVELRDLKFDPVMERLRKEVQYLKSFYKPNVSELGNWGITVNGERIVYPSDFVERTDVFTLFKAKHDSFAPGTSPLEPYLLQHAINIANDAAAVAAAILSDTAFKDAERDSEQATQDRNNLWLPVVAHMRGEGDYLIKLLSNNPKKLGEWGFTIDDSPRAPKVRISNLKIGAAIKLVNVAIGGTFKNLGAGALHIYKGTTTVGTPIIVAANEMLGMTKGFSRIVVVNPSTLIPGKFSVLRHT